ncbi:MAG: hypothetical protein J5787_07445 [Alphaproteobacteria bacterium]|nr:hypothetical protein [Alphaproteobacteria bacterium]MBO4644336.1 hypothetical protein [Alphaproteobacteria bacterium]
MAKPIPEAEQRLIDKLKRLESINMNSTVIIIRLSALNPTNRSPRQVKIALSAINDTVIKTQSGLFLLSNNDIVIIGQALSPQRAGDIAESVRHIFQSDSFAAAHPDDFVQIYALENDFETVMAFAKEHLENVHRQQQPQKAEVPLAPEHLDAILRNIQGFNILKIIRRQEAIQITPQGKLSSLFLEYFTSMADLKKAIAPDVNVLSNRWLFQHLSETLDKRMLGISKELFLHTPKNISLNLNISTIFTPAFENFLSQAPEQMTVIVEVQLMDIIQNTRNFIVARDLLHEAGHQILIDGLPPISFEFMDMKKLNSDLMKLNWSPALINAAESKKLEKGLKDIDPNRLILMRCEDETALAWALMHKITRFQGYFIDALTTAKIRKGCPEKKHCTKEACASRKAGIAGAQRADCLIPSNLDLPIEYKRKKSV